MSGIEKLKNLTAKEIGYCFQVTPRTIFRWAERGLPRSDKSKYDIQKAIAWHLAETVEALGQVNRESSPGLERFRLAKAAREEIRLERDRGQVVNLAAMRAVHVRMAALLRDTSERLGREFGADAQGLLNETLEELEREIQSGSMPDSE